MTDEQEWMPINQCPWQTVVEVRNPKMEKPVRATRGYMTEKGVHPDHSFFTTVFTPDEFWPTPAGRLCCPTEFRLLKESAHD